MEGGGAEPPPLTPIAALRLLLAKIINTLINTSSFRF